MDQQGHRLKGSIVVANEDGVSAAAEIRKRAGDPNFVQVLLLCRNVEPLGQRRYWPIYEAAQEIGLPVGVHAFGFGGNPLTPSGWPSFYIEEMVGHSQCQQTALASLVLEGVFERFPKLKMVMIEAGFGWAPSLAGGSTSIGSGCAARCRISSASRRNTSATTSGGPRSRWKIRSAASICSR